MVPNAVLEAAGWPEAGLVPKPVDPKAEALLATGAVPKADWTGAAAPKADRKGLLPDAPDAPNGGCDPNPVVPPTLPGRTSGPVPFKTQAAFFIIPSISNCTCCAICATLAAAWMVWLLRFISSTNSQWTSSGDRSVPEIAFPRALNP